MNTSTAIRFGGFLVVFGLLTLALYLDAQWWVFMLIAAANVAGFVQGRWSKLAELEEVRR